MAQTIGVVGIFVSGHDLIDALPQEHQRVMAHTIVLPCITELCSQFKGQMMTLIEGAQRQQTGIAGDLAPENRRCPGTNAAQGEGREVI